MVVAVSCAGDKINVKGILVTRFVNSDASVTQIVNEWLCYLEQVVAYK